MSQPSDHDLPSDDALSSAARRALDQQVNSLPASTLRALSEARQQAIGSLSPARHQPALLWGGGITCATALLVAIFLSNGPATELSPTPDFADSDILSAVEELDLYQQLEFYHWLEAEGLAREEV